MQEAFEMKTSESSEEPSNFEKYRNLRKLNSNRAQKLNYLTKSKYDVDNSSNFSEFLNYLGLVAIERASTKPTPIPHIDPHAAISTQENCDLKSKIDLLLWKKPRPKTTPTRSVPAAGKKVHKCVFDFLSSINGSQAPNDSFGHVQNYLKKTQVKKCALVYQNFYCPVKIKKIFQNLYSLNFLKMGDADPNESLDSNSSFSQDLTSMQIYFGNEQSSAALMANLKKIDWCKMNQLTLRKPELSAEDNDLASLISKLELKGDQGGQLEDFFSAKSNEMLVEIVENDFVKFGTVLDNVGGRCKIFVFGSDLTEFYFVSDAYLKSFGWSKRFGFGHTNFEFLADKDRKAFHNLEVDTADFMDQDLPIRKNYLIEVLFESRFYVGCVTEVCNNELIKVRLDSKDSAIDGQVLSFFVDFKNKSKNSGHLYPCKWCERNNMVLGEPSAWACGQKFDWEVYMKNRCKEAQFCLSKQNGGFLSPRSGASSASDQFKVGQYLEVALGKKDQWLYLGKIKALLGNLVFVKVYSEKIDLKNKLYIYASDSCDLYPVGWSQINNYRYFDSSFFFRSAQRVHIDRERMDFHESFLTFVQSEEEICSRVYLNLGVFNCGPYFVKAKLAELPLVYGPGPVFLVIFKLVQNLLSVCEKPFKLLKIIQKIGKQKTDTSSSRTPSHRKVRLKAKERGKYMFRDVEICSKYSQLKEFLSELCHQLKCCTRMISLYENSELTDVYYEANKNLSLDIKCCLLCTLNYYSFQNYEEVKPVEEPVKQRVKNFQKKLKPETNFSPIKTRLNTKAEMLFQEIRQTKIEDENKKNESCSDDEPLIKKTRRFNSQSTSSLLKKESHDAKSDLNNTMPCQISNLVSKSNQNSLVKNSQSGSNVLLSNPSNPVLWSRKEVEQYLIDNKFDSNLVHLIEEHELDGQSFLMLNLPTIQNYMNLKLGPAIKLAHLVERLKIFYFENYKK